MSISYKSTLQTLLNIAKLIIRLLHERDESFWEIFSEGILVSETEVANQFVLLSPLVSSPFGIWITEAPWRAYWSPFL